MPSALTPASLTPDAGLGKMPLVITEAAAAMNRRQEEQNVNTEVG
jgi:hypothetical protein